MVGSNFIYFPKHGGVCFGIISEIHLIDGVVKIISVNRVQYNLEEVIVL